MSEITKQRRVPARGVWVATAVLGTVVAWAYWQPMGVLVRRWRQQPDYLHCFLVAPFAVYLLWRRRELLGEVAWQGSWWGLVLLAASAAIRFAAAYFFFPAADALSLIPGLAGIALLAGGRPLLRWAGPSIGFLVFLVPLPGLAEIMCGHSLQRMGTILSTYVFQTLGLAAVAEGNVIRLPHAELGVAEACSGIRMMLLFLAVCVGAALLMRRPWWQRLLVVASSVPIAVVANVFRITLTGVLLETAGHAVAEAVYHNLAGWFMMPLAMLLLWLELLLLDCVFRRVPSCPAEVEEPKA